MSHYEILHNSKFYYILYTHFEEVCLLQYMYISPVKKYSDVSQSESFIIQQIW
jgi:hypothetical protein